MKKKGKQVMPFVQAVKEDYGKRGQAALQDECLIDQLAILQSCSHFIQSALSLKEVILVDAANDNVDPNVAEKCAPLNPLIQFEF